MAKIAYIQRYLFTIRFVRNRPYCTLKEIITHLDNQFRMHEISGAGLSERTLQRDMSDIRSFLGISIEYDPSRKGYYIPEDEESSSNIEQVLETFDILNSMGGDSGAPDYFFPEKRRSRGTEHLLPLKEAVKKRMVVQFEYQKFHPEQTVIRKVEPYILKESRGRWYLLGFDAGGDHKTSKTFGLDRIFSLQILKQKFVKIQDIDWSKKYEHSFAIFSGDEPERVVLSLDHRDGSYVETMPIHSSQQLTRTDKEVIVELYISITPDFIMELMSRSWSLKIIEPASLRKKVCEIYREAEQRNLG